MSRHDYGNLELVAIIRAVTAVTQQSTCDAVTTSADHEHQGKRDRAQLRDSSPLHGSILALVTVGFSVSTFGTLGYARSGQPYGYQRFID